MKATNCLQLVNYRPQQYSKIKFGLKFNQLKRLNGNMSVIRFNENMTIFGFIFLCTFVSAYL